MPTPAELATLAARMTTDPQLHPAQATEPAQAEDGTQAELDVKAAQLIAKVEQGMSIRQAATEVGLSRMTALRMVRAWDSTDYDGTVRNLLKLKGADAVEAWATAMRAGAVKGNHLPARDLLTHAGIVEPVDGQNGTAKTQIAIVIGTPDAPVSVKSS
jgi:predicted lipid-binding transport protein (Tim44 family)